jgi:hypothetical protein
LIQSPYFSRGVFNSVLSDFEDAPLADERQHEAMMSRMRAVIEATEAKFAPAVA